MSNETPTIGKALPFKEQALKLDKAVWREHTFNDKHLKKLQTKFGSWSKTQRAHFRIESSSAHNMQDITGDN